MVQIDELGVQRLREQEHGTGIVDNLFKYIISSNMNYEVEESENILKKDQEVNDEQEFEKATTLEDENHEMLNVLEEGRKKSSRSTRGTLPVRARLMQGTFATVNTPSKRAASNKQRTAKVRPSLSNQRSRTRELY